MLATENMWGINHLRHDCFPGARFAHVSIVVEDSLDVQYIRSPGHQRVRYESSFSSQSTKVVVSSNHSPVFFWRLEKMSRCFWYMFDGEINSRILLVLSSDG